VASPSIEKILYATYKLPTNGGIPLAFTGTHGTADFITGMKNKGSREINLDTSKIERVYGGTKFLFACHQALKKLLQSEMWYQAALTAKKRSR
jgi:hypothetical protein